LKKQKHGGLRRGDQQPIFVVLELSKTDKRKQKMKRIILWKKVFIYKYSDKKKRTHTLVNF
jgi:hypothetical protein